MISIGEFSRVSSLTVKTLRYYHEMGILMPDKIDEISGYRYYGEDSFSRAESIGILKSLGFSINEIKNIFRDCLTDEDLDHFISTKIQDVDNQIKELQKRKKNLNLYKNMTSGSSVDYSGIKETSFGDFWISGIRFTGLYSEIGERYMQLFKKCGAAVRGKSLAFYYDMEYKENGADVEAVLPLSKEIKIGGVSCRKLEENRAVSSIHKGPYGTQGASYLKLFAYCNDKGYKLKAPLIERYIRGPGMLFKGNEDKYLTEIIILIE